jgi:propionyl-CoA carboxylase alpha chain
VTTIQRLLVANRGEIASRVFRTCRELGIETVAVHSDADAAMPFVREADAAVPLSGNTPAETYLRGDLVVEAARKAGADAIHPGYGFLSENADFARAVHAAGLTWIGPDPDAIEKMGSKIESKKLMEAAGVPVLASLDVESATEADLPLLVKASAGGGGRGMRIVRDLGSLSAEVEAAREEAGSAFGDRTVFVEPYVELGRHVEVQVLGHRNGTLVLGERDCSVQRRHQKVVEEAPAPELPDATRGALHKAARAAADAIDYRGAGTVEFLYDPERDKFFFLEMNTRLQVEHPVTEAVFGVDLVALQIAVAEDRHLDPVAEIPTGHAIEARIYAEDPAHDWQPQSGRLRMFEVPDLPGIRVDSGFESGSTVSTFYDSMLAKIVAWAPTRDAAIRRLSSALRRARIHGLVTNRDLLLAVLDDDAFARGAVSTALIERSGLLAGLTDAADVDTVPVSAFAAAVALAERARLAAKVQSRIPAGFRNVVSQPQLTTFVHGQAEVEVRWYGGRAFTNADRDDVGVVSVTPDEVVLDVAGVRRTFAVHVADDGADAADAVDVESSLGHVPLVRKPRFVDPATQVAAGSLLAPMPGSVIAVHAQVGDVVADGAPILVMEAMKMQHTIAAPYSGTVTELAATVGQQVEAGAVLAVVTPEGDEGDAA